MERLKTPLPIDLGLRTISNQTGLSISRLPNGAIFAIEYEDSVRKVMINQVLGSPISGGMMGLYLRTKGETNWPQPLLGQGAIYSLADGDDRFVWAGERDGLAWQVNLRLHAESNDWFWDIELVNRRASTAICDTILIQDLGLGDRNFLMCNEAYASQYIDHHVAMDERIGHVQMSRQNLLQEGAHPWAMHGCLNGTVAFATDFRQIMGPEWREAQALKFLFGTPLPSTRVQYETACTALQSGEIELAPGASARWTFFGHFEADHPEASSMADLAIIDDIIRAHDDTSTNSTVHVSLADCSTLWSAPAAVARDLSVAEVDNLYPVRRHFEERGGAPLSFFVPNGTHSKHVVLREKEKRVIRRHGALLRSGTSLLPSESTLCVTCWMHGVFAAQLTIGNTSFHQLFSISRDPFNINRDGGLRILIDEGKGWRLLTIPSSFEIDLNQCKWIYRLEERSISITATVSGDESAAQWNIDVTGAPCRFLITGHLALGEHEFGQAGRLDIDRDLKQFSFRPDPTDRWGLAFPNAIYHLVTSSPDAIDTIGSDELLHAREHERVGVLAVIRTHPTHSFSFAVVGSMTDPERAAQLARKYTASQPTQTMLEPAERFWNRITRGIRISSESGDASTQAMDTILPWLVHDAIVHLTVPHGLEQYTGAAWGTRDVCQGPIELFLALEHDEAAKAVLHIIFAQQYEHRGDWPQWFMLEPYSAMQDREAHGDVAIWPLKATCDYIEATGDLSFLEDQIPWREIESLEKTPHTAPIEDHLDKLIETLRARFIPGTSLIRYGNGDWNDSLQPADPSKRDWLVSSWTVAFLFEQICRYALVLEKSGRAQKAGALKQLAEMMRADFNRYLMREGTVAGYGLFKKEGGEPDLLLHPGDHETGIHFSLLPMTRSIIGGLFTPSQAKHHEDLIREHLLFPDGVRLMDRPIDYHGGPERIFRRAESSAFFGREIGLMYVHSHLRYAEAMGIRGHAEELWNALLTVNPIAVTDRLPNASLRQRNAYFSSSDAAFRDRYQASSEWQRVKSGDVNVDGGWRVYSSGSGIYLGILIRYVLGLRRSFGQRFMAPRLNENINVSWPSRHDADRPPPK